MASGFPSRPPRRIFLIGPMGVGKTTLGQQLAQALGYRFLDSDKEIERRTGATIPLIFELEGEAGFRQREAAMIDELSQLDQVVLATGGGAVLRPENRRHLAGRGHVVYLRADIDKLLERTARDRNRPLLQTDNPRQKLLDILETREPLYREIADQVVETGSHTVRETLKLLTRNLQRHDPD